MKIFSKLVITLYLLFLFLPTPTHAREIITDWYIKDLNTEIVINKDSSLDITEWITADCDNLPDKHGIYRVLPTRYYKDFNNWISSPVKLISITDFDGKKIKYSQSKDYANHTITWKIGDADKEVQGINYYLIKYHVGNAIRLDNNKYDQSYWNLNGAFWELEIDEFSATIIFPDEVDLTTTPYQIYSGNLMDTGNNLAKHIMLDHHTLKVTSTQLLEPHEGITIDAQLPKIFTPYEPGLVEKYGWILSFIFPIIAFWISFKLWKKYGKDPKNDRTIVPEFEIPDKLSPLELGMVITDGMLKTNYITAEIINIAVIGVIKIEEIKKKGIFGGKDYKIIKTGVNEEKLTRIQKSLLNNMFIIARDKDFVKNLAGSKKWGFLAMNIFSSTKIGDVVENKNEILLSNLKYEFFKEYYNNIQTMVKSKLIRNKLLIDRNKIRNWLIALGIIVLMAIYIPFQLILYYDSNYLLYSIPSFISSSIIFFIFAFIIKQRSPEGLVLLNKIKGFELYMKTAEKYRQQFNEKENIFERFLPYAIMFGITKEWIKKMKDIYGEKYFANYCPIWFIGGDISSFDANSIESAISSMSSSMNSAMSAASSGGGAGAGGGGGGGGGGGW